MRAPVEFERATGAKRGELAIPVGFAAQEMEDLCLGSGIAHELDDGLLPGFQEFVGHGVRDDLEIEFERHAGRGAFEAEWVVKGGRDDAQPGVRLVGGPLSRMDQHKEIIGGLEVGFKVANFTFVVLVFAVGVGVLDHRWLDVGHWLRLEDILLGLRD